MPLYYDLLDTDFGSTARDQVFMAFYKQIMIALTQISTHLVRLHVSIDCQAYHVVGLISARLFPPKRGPSISSTVAIGQVTNQEQSNRELLSALPLL